MISEFLKSSYAWASLSTINAIVAFVLAVIAVLFVIAVIYDAFIWIKVRITFIATLLKSSYAKFKKTGSGRSDKN